MVTNRDLQDFEAWEKGRNSLLVNMKKSMSPSYVIMLLVIVAVGIYILKSVEGINKNIVIIALAAIIIAVIWRLTSKKDEKEPIPEHIIKILAWKNMQRKIGIEYPMGTTITNLPYCKMRFEGEWGDSNGFRPWKWHVGMKITYPDTRVEEILVVMHPYEGYVTGKVLKAIGYTGIDDNDLKLMPVNFIVNDDKKPK